MTYEVHQGKAGESDFTFYGRNRDFVRYKGPEAIVHGPAETGKTISTLYKLHLCACKYPGAAIVIVRKTLSSTYSTVLQTFMGKVLGPDVPRWPCKPYGGENKPERFIYGHGPGRPESQIWMAGMDKSSKVLSSEFDLAYVNQVEELALDEWETLTTRTTGRAGHMPYSQTIGDANPAYPAHWMYNRETLRLFYSRHVDNPVLYDPLTGQLTEQGVRTMAVLNALTGVRKQRLRYGKPAQAEGAIYDEWDESIHLIYEEDLPRTFRWVAAQDWGYRNAGVLGVWAIDGESRMYLVAQIYRTGKTSDWWTERAVELYEEFDRRIEAFVCDPSQPDYIEQYKRAGLPAQGGHNAVLPGINKVKERLALAEDEKPRLCIVRDCSRYIDEELRESKKPWAVEQEIPGYVWANRKAKETPIKEDDHGCDMARYAVAYVDGLGRKEKRTVRAMR